MTSISESKKKDAKFSTTSEQILIIDDDPLILKALSMTLVHDNYSVTTALSGEKAINILKQIPFALIICDLYLPGMTGIDVLKEAIELQPDAIRIIITASNDLNTVIEAINVGQVSKFILKPWDQITLSQTILNAMEQYRLKKENKRLYELISLQHKKLRQSHESLRQELRIGAQIHKILLMGHAPLDIPEIAIAATSEPSRGIDGDFFDFYRPSPEILDIAIGDVMGKGIPAALVGTAIKTQLIRFALPSRQAYFYDRHDLWHYDALEPEEILSLVHTETVKQLIDLEYFVSLFYGRLNLRKHTFSFVDCGSAKPLHYSAASQNMKRLAGPNLPLGIAKDEHYIAREISFGSGDTFLFYSDGVTEAYSPEGEFFGPERLEKLVKEQIDLPPTELISWIKKSVTKFTKKTHFNDDFTLIIIKIGDLSHLPKPQNLTGKFSSDLSQLKVVRQFIQRICQGALKDNTTLSGELQLAINEIFCNIVTHAYEGDSHHEIILNGEIDDKGVHIEIAEKGKSFDPSSINEPDFTGQRDDGFGLYLVRQLIDKLEYIPKGSATGWNRWRIFKYFIDLKDHMEITHSKQGSILIVILEGSHLDAKDTVAFKQQVQDLILTQNSTQLIFDLHQLQFIDSSGLGSFLSILRLLHARGGELKLANMTKPIRSMFELVSMHKIFEIFNSTEDALESFKS